MAVERKLMTAEELLRLPHDDVRHELIDGELRTMPLTGVEHGGIEFRISYRIGRWLDENPVALVLVGETGIVLRRDPDRVRAPDIAVIRRERLPAGPEPKGFLEGLMPDLVVEIVSPGDTASEVEDKVQEWLSAAVPAVWVVYAVGPRLWLYRPDGTARVHGPDDWVEGGEVLPGFRVQLNELLRHPGG